MRVMVVLKATKSSEAGVMPSQQLLTEMGTYNEELVKAGLMLAGDGRHPSSKAKLVLLAGGKRKVTGLMPDAPRSAIEAVWRAESARRLRSRRPARSASPTAGAGTR